MFGLKSLLNLIKYAKSISLTFLSTFVYTIVETTRTYPAIWQQLQTSGSFFSVLKQFFCTLGRKSVLLRQWA